MTIILDDDSNPDSSPDSDSPVDPDILKHSKLSSADHADIGWESPEDWEYDETIAQKIAKLKKKQDGEVYNSPASPRNPDLAKEATSSTPVTKAKRSAAVVSPVSGTRSSARGKGSEAIPILQRAVNHAAVKAGNPPSTSNSPDPAYIALSSFPDLHFMGLAGDCGIVLGNSSLSSAAALSVVRSREVAQAKLVEAIDHAASREAARAAETSQQASQVESTSVGTAPMTQSQAECLAEETGDPETITVVSLSKKRKQKGPAMSLPARTNLRSTPARQARALKIGSQ
jgi:hypothetical protein